MTFVSQSFEAFLSAMIATRTWILTTLLCTCWLGVPAQGAGLVAGTVVAWGDNRLGQTSVPVGPTNLVAVSAGYDRNLALTAEGRVVPWGSTIPGDNTIAPALSAVAATAVGGQHSLALRTNHTVVAWGDNSLGQTNVPADLTNVIAIAAGTNHSLALKSNHNLVAWGQYDPGTGKVAATVPPGLTNIIAIACGDSHCLAVRSNALVVAWGNNTLGQTNVPTGLTNVIAVAAGAAHSLALRSSGVVVAWGNNASGQTNVPADLTNVIAIAAAGSHSLALKADGTLTAWGDNTYGQSSVPRGLTNSVGIAAGYFHSAAVTLDALLLSSPPPYITLANGASTNLNVSVWSRTPYTCQWSFNGVALPGGTSNSYLVSNFNSTNAGTYSLAVSNFTSRATATTVLHLTNSPIIWVDGVFAASDTVSRTNSAQIVMSTTFGSGAIYYTLDGSDPDFTGTHYTGSIVLTNSATLRAIAYNAAHSASAEASPLSLYVWPIYPLIVTTAGGGSFDISPLPYGRPNYYVSNTVVTLTARTNVGWSFMSWQSDLINTDLVTQVVMDQAHSIQAVFGTALSVFTVGGGQVSLDPPAAAYPYGTKVLVTARPSSNYAFFGWADAASGFANPYSLTVTNPTPGLTALFGLLKSNQVSLTVVSNGAGTVQVTPAAQVYTNGDTVTLIAVPTTNHVFAGWSDDASGMINPLIVGLNRSKYITANFVSGSPTKPTVTVEPPLSRTLSAGASTLLTAQTTGDSPLFYQWRLNSIPIAGRSRAALLMTNLTAAEVGLYDVLVSGAAGSVTSVPVSIALFGIETAQSGSQPLPLLVLDHPPRIGYQIEFSTNLPPQQWQWLVSVTNLDTRFYYLDPPNPNQPSRFYRAAPH